MRINSHSLAFLIGRLLLFSPIIVMIIIINYLVDPIKMQKRGFERDVAKVVLEKKLERFHYNNYERLVYKYYVDCLTERKDIVVFGSSRSGQIRSAELDVDKVFFNNSVNAATLEDYMALYYLYKRKKLVPKVVVLELSPWLLNKNSDIVPPRLRRILRNEYEKMATLLGVEMSWNDCFNKLDEYREYIDFSYFQISLKRLVNLLLWNKKTQPVQVQEVEETPLLDLKIVHDAAIRDAHANPIRGLGNFPKIDPFLRSLFEAFIAMLKKDQVRVVFFLPPYHPIVYQKLLIDPEYTIVFKVQDYFIEIAHKYNIELVGSYDAAVCQLEEGDFTDGLHTRESSTKKIFKNIAF